VRKRKGGWLARALVLVAVGAGAGCAHLVVLHDPLTADEHNDLGVAYEASGHAELARSEYRKSVRLDPARCRAWVNLGNVDAAEGKWAAAEKSYRRALGADPADADAMNNLAVSLMKQGRNLDEARMLAERAVAAGGPRIEVYRSTVEELGRSSDNEPRQGW
jgi:Flp pilus assembly protein TadD